MKLIICLFLCFFSLVRADAEKARATLEAIIRKDGSVPIATQPILYNHATSPKERLTEAEIAIRRERFKTDWPEFLRKFTEDPPPQKGPGLETGGKRIIKSNTFWKEFFSGSSSDEVMRAADTWTGNLLNTVKTQQAIANLEQDSAKRSRMIGRLERAEKDLTAWRKVDRESGRARRLLAGSLVDLVAPL